MHRPRARECSCDEVAAGDGDHRAVSLWRPPPAQRDVKLAAGDQGSGELPSGQLQPSACSAKNPV
jgi:hypothetical protein